MYKLPTFLSSVKPVPINKCDLLTLPDPVHLPQQTDISCRATRVRWISLPLPPLTKSCFTLMLSFPLHLANSLRWPGSAIVFPGTPTVITIPYLTHSLPIPNKSFFFNPNLASNSSSVSNTFSVKLVLFFRIASLQLLVMTTLTTTSARACTLAHISYVLTSEPTPLPSGTRWVPPELTS